VNFLRFVLFLKMANYAVIFLISYTLFIAPTFSTNLSGSFGVNQLLSYFLDSWITIVYTSVPDLENVFTETFINSFSPIALTESELIDQSFAPVRKLYFGQVFIILPSPKSVIITLYRQARLQINHPTTAQGPYSDQTIHPFTRSRNALLI